MLRPDEKQRLAARWPADAYRVGMVWRWRSNDTVPPADVMDAAVEMGLASALEVAASAAMRERDFAEFRRAYVARQPATPSAEEQYEMRAAFGPGETVVDVISGRRWTT